MLWVFWLVVLIVFYFGCVGWYCCVWFVVCFWVGLGCWWGWIGCLVVVVVLYCCVIVCVWCGCCYWCLWIVVLVLLDDYVICVIVWVGYCVVVVDCVFLVRYGGGCVRLGWVGWWYLVFWYNLLVIGNCCVGSWICGISVVFGFVGLVICWWWCMVFIIVVWFWYYGFILLGCDWVMLYCVWWWVFRGFWFVYWLCVVLVIVLGVCWYVCFWDCVVIVWLRNVCWGKECIFLMLYFVVELGWWGSCVCFLGYWVVGDRLVFVLWNWVCWCGGNWIWLVWWWCVVCGFGLLLLCCLCCFWWFG